MDHKSLPDLYRKATQFHAGDIDMSIRPEQYPKSSVKKLHARALVPFPVIRPLRSNTLIDLPIHMNINDVCNVGDLTLCIQALFVHKFISDFNS